MLCELLSYDRLYLISKEGCIFCSMTEGFLINNNKEYEVINYNSRLFYDINECLKISMFPTLIFMYKNSKNNDNIMISVGTPDNSFLEKL